MVITTDVELKEKSRVWGLRHTTCCPSWESLINDEFRYQRIARRVGAFEKVGARWYHSSGY